MQSVVSSLSSEEENGCGQRGQNRRRRLGNDDTLEAEHDVRLVVDVVVLRNKVGGQPRVTGLAAHRKRNRPAAPARAAFVGGNSIRQVLTQEVIVRVDARG